MLQLALLVLVTCLVPHFPSGSGVAFDLVISTILTAAVLLAAICILTSLVQERFIASGRTTPAHRISVGTHAFYPSFVVAVTIAYLVAYA